MNVRPDDPDVDAMARWTARVLARQPAMQAPASLEGRVLAALEGQVAKPWWRHSIARWPLLAQATFLAASIACLWLSVFLWTLPEVAGGASAPLPFASLPGAPVIHMLADVASALRTVSSVIARAVPAPWWYGSLALVGAAYTVLFGLGAFGYRTFRRPPLPSATGSRQ